VAWLATLTIGYPNCHLSMMERQAIRVVLLGELEARFDLPLGVEAPRAARHAIGAVLQSWGFWDRDWLAQVQVVVSELVSNAVMHGGGSLAVDVKALDERVIIGAADGSSAVPRRLDPGEPAGGRGLAVIEAFAVGWGVHDHDGGKRVWVQLPPYPAGDRSAG
jgi:anti-sigma regulatory factor (Ser/Thr protein kinase)